MTFSLNIISKTKEPKTSLQLFHSFLRCCFQNFALFHFTPEFGCSFLVLFPFTPVVYFAILLAITLAASSFLPLCLLIEDLAQQCWFWTFSREGTFSAAIVIPAFCSLAQLLLLLYPGRQPIVTILTTEDDTCQKQKIPRHQFHSTCA